jgi:glutamate-1-semialdehyde 2,1-aminomutase
MQDRPGSPRSYERSRALYEAGRQYTTEGVQHPLRYQTPHPIYMDHGQGGWIYDVDGNPYIDFTLGAGPLILGHGHPAVLDAVARQMARAQLYSGSAAVELELARRIHERVPSAEVVRFFVSGTDATTTAIRLARAFTRRELIVKHVGAFHGAQDYFLPGVAAAGGVDGVYLGVPRPVSDQTLVVPFNDTEALDRVFAAHGSQLAAVIAEPALRGVVAPQPGYLEALRDRCRSFDTLLVYDEVLTGFRLGPAGAEGYFGVRPDLTAYGKIIGGGFPIGAVAGRADVMSLLSPKLPPAEQVFSTSTWLGYPIAMAAGCAMLDALSEPGVYDRLFALGECFRRQFNAVFARLDRPGQAIGIGPTNDVVLTDRAVVDLDSAQPRYARASVLALKRRIFDLGLFMIGPSYLPSFGKFLCTAHTEADIEQAALLFEQAIQDVDL